MTRLLRNCLLAGYGDDAERIKRECLPWSEMAASFNEQRRRTPQPGGATTE